MAAHWIKTNTSPSGSITFFSDSQAAIKALQATTISSKLIKDTLETLNTLGENYTVDLRWIPGHMGAAGNERADELARAGSLAVEQGPEPYLPLSEGVIKAAITAHIHSIHLRAYKNTALSEKGKIPLSIILKKYKYRGFKVAGKEQRWLTWLLSGHSPLAYFQYKANNFMVPFCEHCPGEEETSEHFLCHCVGYMTIRLHTLGSPILTWEKVISHKLSSIFSYIEATKRFDGEDIFTERREE